MITHWRPLLTALALSLTLVACKDPAPPEATGPVKPQVDHQLAARAAIVAGDAQTAKAKLQASIDAGEPLIGPVRLMGGWQQLGELWPWPESDDPWATSVRSAAERFRSGDDTGGHALLEQATTEADDTNVTPYVYLALSYLDSGRDTSGSGAVWRGRDLASDGWLGMAAVMVIDSRAKRPAVAQKTAAVLENARFSPQRSAAANYYAARQALIDGKPDIADACIAVAMSVWGPQFQETKPPAADDAPDAPSPDAGAEQPE